MPTQHSSAGARGSPASPVPPEPPGAAPRPAPRAKAYGRWRAWAVPFGFVALWSWAASAVAAPVCPEPPARVPMPVEATPGPVKVDEWKKSEGQITQQMAGEDLSATRLVFIGTDDANWHSRPEDTALGLAEIVRFIRSRSPTRRVPLLGLPPRGADASAPERSVDARVNQLIRTCADGPTACYLEPGQALMGADGRISDRVMFDVLHPTMVGDGILGGAIDAQVRKSVD